MKVLPALGVLLLVASCSDPAAVAGDAASLPVVLDAGDPRDAGSLDAGDAAREAAVADGGDDGASHDGGDGGDADDAGDAVSRWDIILPDVVDAGSTLNDAPRGSATDLGGALDVATVVDRPEPLPDVVAPDDRPDVVIAVDRPDVVIAHDVVTPIDRPDVVIAHDVVTPIDRPDVVVAFDIVTPMDRPDVVAPNDRPDVVAAPDLVTPVDRPDVVTPVDTGAAGPDPVAYSGTFPVRTGVFTATLTIAGERRSVRLAVPANAGASPPMILLFHGTNGDGSVAMTESNAAALANAEGVIVAAPSSRWLPVGDFDHVDAETYWETQRNTNPDSNQDVLLARAIIVEAQRAYGVDPARVYAMGHSNGGFFAVFLATLLPQRIAAFAENSAGLVTCPRTTTCRFQGSGTSCATLATRGGWCNCTGPELPMPLASAGRRVPGFISHGTADPLVSVYYSCTLQARMTALGMPVQITLFNGEGHAVPANWAQLVWPFFRPLRVAP